MKTAEKEDLTASLSHEEVLDLDRDKEQAAAVASGLPQKMRGTESNKNIIHQLRNETKFHKLLEFSKQPPALRMRNENEKLHVWL